MREITLIDNRKVSPIMKDVYRRLRTNIEFTGVENRVICVTSCGVNDGKSSVSYQLARIFTENDKNVLLIDADLRNSAMYKWSGIKQETKGLSHYLSGKENLTDVMYATNYPNFFLLPTGVLPKNPTELLANPRFAELIAAVKDAFDYVFIDTPPLGAVVDAAVVAKECDGSILVIPADCVSRKVAYTIKEQLTQANSNLLGVILNKVDTKNSSYGKKYGYGYGYSYGYGYGNGYGYGHGASGSESKGK
jgi:capsular exopolysaccharide synthesis family protein